MRKIYRSLSIIFAFAFVLSGCTGAALRAGMTDKTTYQQMSGSVPDIKSGYGRAFIYVPKSGPDIMDTLGIIDFISIDKSIYRFGGESYFYLDIEAGSHQATITEVVKPRFGSNKKQYGKNKIEITVPESRVIYMKITGKKTRAYTLEVVSKSIAEKEMQNLPLWTNSATIMCSSSDFI